MVIDVRRQQVEEPLAQRVEDARWDGWHERSTSHGASAPSRAWYSCLPRRSTTPNAPITPIGGRPECHEDGGLPPDHACGESRNAWRKEARSSCCTLGWI